MKNSLIVGSIILMVLLSACSVSNYLKGEVPQSNPTDEQDIDQLISELTDEETPVEDLENLDNSESDELVDETEDESVDDEEILTDAEDVPTITDEELTDDSFIKLTVNENELVKLNIKAQDLNQDKLTYKYTEPLDSSGQWQTRYGDAGNYLVTVTVSDGKEATTKKVLLVVERVNVPPTIEGVESEFAVSEGDVVKLAPVVKDPNGDKVEVTISEPVGDDGVWETGYTDRGEYEVIISATDGELTSTKSVSLTVEKKNIAPDIESLSDITINEGESVEIVPVVTDANGDDVTVTISEPVGDDGIWETGYTDHGKYEIVVKASDGELETTKTIVLTVIAVNKAPDIQDITLE